MSNIAIIGSRTFLDFSKGYDWYKKIIEHLNITIDKIVSGGATGADTIAEQIAQIEGIETLIFLPDWKKFGRKAGHLRNTDIIKNSDYVIAFWNFRSTGTKDSITKANKLSKFVIAVNYKTGEIHYDYRIQKN